MNEVTNRDLKREDIIRIAQEGGLAIKGRLYEDVVIAVAMRVAAAEREACAKVCDELRDEDGFEPYGTECAAAIRARGEV